MGYPRRNLGERRPRSIIYRQALLPRGYQSSAFNELRARNLKVFRPERTTCSPDHNIPTLNQDKPIADPAFPQSSRDTRHQC